MTNRREELRQLCLKSHKHKYIYRGIAKLLLDKRNNCKWFMIKGYTKEGCMYYINGNYKNDIWSITQINKQEYLAGRYEKVRTETKTNNSDVVRKIIKSLWKKLDGDMCIVETKLDGHQFYMQFNPKTGEL